MGNQERSSKEKGFKKKLDICAIECASQLVAYGADVLKCYYHKENAKNYLAADLAEEQGHSELATWLRAKQQEQG